MKVITITLVACHGTTEATMEVSDEEYAFLERVQEQVNDMSEWGCSPTMFVEEEPCGT